MSEIQYPECEKMSAVRVQSQAIGEFLEWLQYEKGWTISYIPEEYDHTLVPAMFQTEELLAEFFGIDLTKVEAERRQILDAQRALNDA